MQVITQRTIARIIRSPFHQGFLGEGHLAAAIIDGSKFSQTDPFILLMDDQLDLPGGEPVGGPHPHAGFETVTLVLEGDGQHWKSGSLELMTAGKGIIHTEEITGKTKMRILQLWLALPPEKRWIDPFFQELLPEEVPALRINKNEIKVYSGSSNGLTSPLQNYTPLTLVEFNLEQHTEAKQVIPEAQNGFIYVVDGAVWVGEQKVEQGEAAWFNQAEADGESEVVFKTRDGAARFVLYAAQPHHAPIVSHGPFIGDTQSDILRLYGEYRQGKMPHLNSLPESRKVRYH